MKQLHFLLGAALLGFGLHSPTFAGDKDVNVVNTPNVNVVNTPTVQIAAPPAPVVTTGGPTQLLVGSSLLVFFLNMDVDVTDVIVSIQETAGDGCSLIFTGGVRSGLWFNTDAGVGNGIEKFHFDPPIPSLSSDPFRVYVSGIGTPSGYNCRVFITMLGIQR